MTATLINASASQDSKSKMDSASPSVPQTKPTSTVSASATTEPSCGRASASPLISAPSTVTSMSTLSAASATMDSQ
jgi:hypothetical protein